MAVIDSDNFITHLVWSGLIDKATCGELKEAIELCTVKDIYTKADMVAMLEDLDLQIDESAAYNLEVAKVQRLIRDRINKLKGTKDGNVD